MLFPTSCLECWMARSWPGLLQASTDAVSLGDPVMPRGYSFALVLHDFWLLKRLCSLTPSGPLGLGLGVTQCPICAWAFYWYLFSVLRTKSSQKKYKWIRNTLKGVQSVCLAIGRIQIKSALRFHFTPVRLVKIKKTKGNKRWWRYGEQEPSDTLGGSENGCSHYGNQCGSYSKN